MSLLLPLMLRWQECRRWKQACSGDRGHSGDKSAPVPCPSARPPDVGGKDKVQCSRVAPGMFRLQNGNVFGPVAYLVPASANTTKTLPQTPTGWETLGWKQVELAFSLECLLHSHANLNDYLINWWCQPVVIYSEASPIILSEAYSQVTTYKHRTTVP